MIPCKLCDRTEICKYKEQTEKYFDAIKDAQIPETMRMSIHCKMKGKQRNTFLNPALKCGDCWYFHAGELTDRNPSRCRNAQCPKKNTGEKGYSCCLFEPRVVNGKVRVTPEEWADVTIEQHKEDLFKREQSGQVIEPQPAKKISLDAVIAMEKGYQKARKET